MELKILPTKKRSYTLLKEIMFWLLVSISILALYVLILFLRNDYVLTRNGNYVQIFFTINDNSFWDYFFLLLPLLFTIWFAYWLLQELYFIMKALIAAVFDNLETKQKTLWKKYFDNPITMKDVPVEYQEVYNIRKQAEQTSLMFVLLLSDIIAFIIFVFYFFTTLQTKVFSTDGFILLSIMAVLSYGVYYMYHIEKPIFSFEKNFLKDDTIKYKRFFENEKDKESESELSNEK